ncbi:MAG: glycosyltransferase [Candidatus Bathyarchaeia archaeon]
MVEKWGEPWNEGYKNLANYTYLLLKNVSGIDIDVLTKENNKLSELRGCDLIWVFNYPELPATIPHILKMKLNIKKPIVKFLAKKELDINFREKAKTMLYRSLIWDVMVTTTELLKLEMARHFCSSKIFVLPPPIPTDYFHPIDKELARKALDLKEDLIYIGYCGKVNKHVKLNIMAEALKSRSLPRDFVLLLAISHVRTKDDLNRLLLFLKRIAIPVKFVRVNDIRLFYSAVDLLVYPVEREGAIEPPLTLLEAMSCGTLVAALENPVTRALIKDMYTGFTFKYPSELGVIIEELFRSSHILHIISEQARKTILNTFSFSKLIKTYLNFITYWAST